MSIKHKLSALLILGLIGFSFVFHHSIYLFFNHLGVFNINRILVQGATVSQNTEFNKILYTTTNTSYNSLVDLDIYALKKQLESLDLIKSVEINKDFPKTLSIIVEERIPIALIKTLNSTYIADKDGHILPNNQYITSPTIEVDYGIALNQQQIADDYLVTLLSSLANIPISTIETIKIDKNRKASFKLKNTTPFFDISTRILDNKLFTKATAIATQLTTNNTIKIPKTIDIYSDKDTAIGFY